MVIVLSLFGSAVTHPVFGENRIVPPDAATAVYDAGRKAARAGRYADAVRLLNQALATGYVSPSERLGTSRNFVDRYDPSYWLGVSYMELGDDLRAREQLLLSRSAGLIASWPEASDLNRRLTTLERRADARSAASSFRGESLVPPAPTVTPTIATPPLVPVTPPARQPREPGDARPSPEPTSIATPPIATPPAPTSIPPFSTPFPGPSSTPPPTAIAPRVAAASAPELIAALAYLESGDWSHAQDAIASHRRKNPGAVESDLLEAVVLGSRYVLEGRSDPALADRARTSLRSYRKRGGGKRGEEIWISPALAAVFGER